MKGKFCMFKLIKEMFLIIRETQLWLLFRR
jgi:hypothetical protein